MRTPGDDMNLSLGLLYSLGIIAKASDVESYKVINDHQLIIYLIHTNIPEAKIHSSFSSCGICNSQSWEEVNFHSIFPVFDKAIRFSSNTIHQSHIKLTESDDYFSLTGGNHKVALWSEKENKIFVAEDVGRHNALDKVIGKCISGNLLPLKNYIAILSGRCSFEMCQKTWLAGIPIIVSRGAPTSKAIELADNAGITLIGFARSESFNVYTHPYRIENERK